MVTSGGYEIVLGRDGNCKSDDTAKCNGYLRAHTKYKCVTCVILGALLSRVKNPHTHQYMQY